MSAAISLRQKTDGRHSTLSLIDVSSLRNSDSRRWAPEMPLETYYQGRYAIPCLLYRDAFLRQFSPRQRIRGFAIMRYRNLLLTLTYLHWHTTRFQVVTSLTWKLIPTALDNFRPQCTQNFEWFRHSSEVRYRDETFVPHRRQTTTPVMMLSRTVDVKLFLTFLSLSCFCVLTF